MVKAKKSLGQNFLKDEEVLRKIVEAAELKKEDQLVEIGPGQGFLTKALLEKSDKLIAVELDDRLIVALLERFKRHPGFVLKHENALQFIPPAGPYKIVANIPYYITSPLLNHFLLEQFQYGNPPELMVLMVQKEVAEKICAKNKGESVLSLEVKLFGEVEMVTKVPNTAFLPMPSVDSAVIKIRVAKEPKIKGDLKKIFWIFHVSFAQRRKKLSNNLAAVLQKEPAEMRTLLESIDIHTDKRAEELSFEEWQKLYDKISELR